MKQSSAALAAFVVLALAIPGCSRESREPRGVVSRDSLALLIHPLDSLSLDDDRPPTAPSEPPVAADEPSPKPAAKFEPAPAEQCDPNYTPCVPIDSDVDCARGRGNGPSYVAGPVRVIGRDVYDLDGDHDGVGCER